MNGNTDSYAQQMVDDEGNRLLSAEYDESKWARAAAAARDVMELPGNNNGHRYQLYVKNRIRGGGTDDYPRPSSRLMIITSPKKVGRTDMPTLILLSHIVLFLMANSLLMQIRNLFFHVWIT